MIYTIELYTKKKNYKRDYYYEKTDITNECVMPIMDVQRLDKALDTSSLVLYRNNHKVIRPFSKIIIRIDYGTQKETIYRYVESDRVELVVYGEKKVYKHNLELIEPTKILERFIVDNTTITNLLAFLYSDKPFIYPQIAPVDVKVGKTIGVWYSNSDYTSDARYYNKCYLGDDYNIDVPYKVKSEYTIFHIPLDLNEISYEIIKPDGTVITIDLSDPIKTIKPDQEGDWVIKRHYNKLAVEFDFIEVDCYWYFTVEERGTVTKKQPTRYTIAEVINNILIKVSAETTAPRKNLDEQLFFLDPSLTRLTQEYSPEFTFTQNTLFGVLEQIGSQIHAIPRLIPNSTDETQWNIITFDFLGGQNKVTLDNYKIISEEYSLDADNYTSGFVSNIENSFQTNNVDYISLKEPWENGFVSARTNNSNFEISNDSAIIKTSRPIQRIISLKVMIEGADDTPVVLDITKFVKEHSDYLLLKDYALNPAEVTELRTKSSAIYYTRGGKTIEGLTYYAPEKFQIGYLDGRRAIETIITLAQGKDFNGDIKDLAFNIEYVPFYSFKAKQYKTLISEDSGSNELFFNQQDAQNIDIESYGENMRGALMMTSNVEKTLTGYIKDVNGTQIKAGDLLDGYYYAYQVNREFVDKNIIKATIRLTKNFNKLNSYLGIKKNYREWEISNRECYGMNPMVNEFCIISTQTESTKIENMDISDEEKLRLDGELLDELKSYHGFITKKVLLSILATFSPTNASSENPVRWAFIKTNTRELDFNGKESIITRTFVAPASCFSMGNSAVMTFTTDDNYSASTTSAPLEHATLVEEKHIRLEEYVKYGNKYGQVDDAFIMFGGGEAIKNSLYSGKLYTAQKLYKTDAEIDKSNAIVDYYDSIYPITINKDSRQQLSFTAQLNFVTDNEKIWISSNLSKFNGMVGKQEGRTCYVAYFRKSPNQFLNDYNMDDVIETGSIQAARDDAFFEIEICGYSGQPILNEYAPVDCEGFGIIRRAKEGSNIDKNDKILLYYNEKLKKGDKMPHIYLQLRRKI